jgi:hypothetical protein
MSVWPWVAIAGLGAYHGIDPSMGWLFAVALGLQEHRRSKVLAALPPIAIGHVLSIATVVALVGWAQAAVSPWHLRIVGAAALIVFGLFKFIRPLSHPRWVAMKVNSRDLVAWSFLMATAHGAGLMLFPILMDMPAPHAEMHGRLVRLEAVSLTQGVAVVLVHAGAMVLVMGVIAVLVYEWVGLAVLRSAWVNLDTLWAGALVAAGVLSLVV